MEDASAKPFTAEQLQELMETIEKEGDGDWIAEVAMTMISELGEARESQAEQQARAERYAERLSEEEHKNAILSGAIDDILDLIADRDDTSPLAETIKYILRKAGLGR